jgi:hypothetical protein
MKKMQTILDKRLDMLELRNLQNNRILEKKLQTLSNSRMKNMHHVAMTSVRTYLHNCSLPRRNTCRVKGNSMMIQQQKSMLRQSFSSSDENHYWRKMDARCQIIDQ